MPHVTFIHGIGNKVEKDRLEQAWLDSLREGGGPDLLTEGVKTSMCYWADILYEAPLPDAAASTEAGEEAEVLAAQDVGMSWYTGLPPAQSVAVRELAAEIGATSWLADGVGDAGVDAEPLSVGTSVDFEAIPLPEATRRRLMKAFLRDVHHYLWNANHTRVPKRASSFATRCESAGWTRCARRIWPHGRTWWSGTAWAASSPTTFFATWPAHRFWTAC